MLRKLFACLRKKSREDDAVYFGAIPAGFCSPQPRVSQSGGMVRNSFHTRVTWVLGLSTCCGDGAFTILKPATGLPCGQDEDCPPRSGSGLPQHTARRSPDGGSPAPSCPCRYPHDVVNHLSCDEARNHYGGVVSLLPIILDLMKEWVAHSEKLPRKALQHVSEPRARQEATAAAAGPPQTSGARPGSQKPWCRRLRKDSLKPKGKNKGSSKPPWRPPGGKL